MLGEKWHDNCLIFTPLRFMNRNRVGMCNIIYFVSIIKDRSSVIIYSYSVFLPIYMDY